MALGSCGMNGSPALRPVGVESKHVYARVKTLPQPTGERSVLVTARRRNIATPRPVPVSRVYRKRFSKAFTKIGFHNIFNDDLL